MTAEEAAIDTAAAQERLKGILGTQPPAKPNETQEPGKESRQRTRRGPRRKAGVPVIPGLVTCTVTLWNTPSNFQKIADLLEENEMPGPARDIREQLIVSLTQMVAEHSK